MVPDSAAVAIARRASPDLPAGVLAAAGTRPAITAGGLARGPGALRRIAGYVGEAALLVLVAWLFPLAILALGLPVALLLWILVGIAERL